MIFIFPTIDNEISSTSTRRPDINVGQSEIYINVLDPSIETVEIGSTIRFRCDARSRRNRVRNFLF